MLTIGAAAAFAAGALVLAGCGGSSTVSKEDYTDSVVSARDRVDFALAQITVGSGDMDDLVERMEAAADKIDEAADDFDGSGSADGFDDETDEAGRRLSPARGGSCRHGARRERRRDGRPTDRHERAAVPGWTKANRVLASLDEQGITVEPIASH